MYNFEPIDDSHTISYHCFYCIQICVTYLLTVTLTLPNLIPIILIVVFFNKKAAAI
jgi:hypothetical protein